LGKLLFLLILALVVWWFFKGILKSRSRGEPPPAQSPTGEKMVACARCGVNMPRSEAQEEGGRFYCVNNPHCHA
jgi:uncharacterized protein